MFSAPQNQCCVPHDHPGADLGTIVGWRFAFDNRPSRLCGRRRRSHKTDCAYDRSRLGLIHCSIPGLGREFATADPVCASVLPTGAPQRKLGLDDRWDSDNDSRLGHPFRSHRKYAALTPNAAASAAVKALPAGGPSEISALTWFTHERANMKRLYRLFAARRRHWRWELNPHICAPSLYVGTSDFSKPTKRRPTRRSILLNYARRLLWLFPNVLVRRPDRRGRRGRIGIVSERRRGRSREQATTTTTAAGEPLAGLAFFVEDMECRQADIGNFLLAQCNFVSHSCAARQQIRCRRTADSLSSTRQRQRQPGRS